MRPCRSLWVLGVSLLLTGGCGDNLKPDKTQPPPAVDDNVVVAPVVGPWVRFAPDPKSAEEHRFRRWFPIYDTRDILAVVAVPEAAGTRVVRLEIVGPEGTLYQTIWRAFTTDSSVGGTTSHPVTRAPLPVAPVQVVAGLARMLVPIAVAGTDITKFGLKGTYSVKVFVEGAEPVCESTFEIRGLP